MLLRLMAAGGLGRGLPGLETNARAGSAGSGDSVAGRGAAGEVRTPHTCTEQSGGLAVHHTIMEVATTECQEHTILASKDPAVLTRAVDLHAVTCRSKHFAGQNLFSHLTLPRTLIAPRRFSSLRMADHARHARH